MKYILVSPGVGADQYFVEFDPPQFKDNASDYWVVNFSVTITNNIGYTIQKDIAFSPDTVKYKSETFDLDHGYEFRASVKTVYKIIDSNYELRTSKEASASKHTSMDFHFPKLSVKC